MKVLLTRFGGMGDIFPVSVAAKQLVKRGHSVDVALRDDGGPVKNTIFFENQNTDKLRFLDFKEFGPWHDRCVKTAYGWRSVQATYNDYDLVVDFMNCIEGNSTSPTNNYKDLWEFWQRSRSSNWVNWYDLHLAWVNIDPTKVPDDEKRPELFLTDEEKAKAAEFKAKHKKLFVIHPFASSLARSWYQQSQEMVPKLIKAYEGAAVAFWNPNTNKWDFITKRGVTPMEKLADNPLRETMVLLSAADLVITVDTGCSHIAEGLGVKTLCIYSTVPAWTRNKYYKHQTHIDLGEKCPEYYTFSLSLGDPLHVKDGLNNLSEREKLVKKLWEDNVGPEEAMKRLNSDMRGADLELRLYLAKQETWERQQSKALSNVTVDMVFDKVKELVNDG